MNEEEKKDDVNSETPSEVDNSMPEESAGEAAKDKLKAAAGDAAKSAIKSAWKKLPLQYKLIVIGVIAGIFFALILTVCMIGALIDLGIIDKNDIAESVRNNSIGYSDISSSTTYWWPIGSTSTEVIDGNTFASGTDIPDTELKYNNNTVDIISEQDITYYIIASDVGTVVETSSSCSSNEIEDSCGDGYGNYVKIQHSGNVTTMYAHLDSIKVNKDDEVKKGQVIGIMGSSGKAASKRLHYEVIVNGSSVDVSGYISSSNPRPEVSEGNTIVGTDNKQTVCLTLFNRGYSVKGVIALMANINRESGFNFNVLGDYVNGEATSYGLCQWHNERWDNLKSSYPTSWQTIGGQIDFLTYELSNGYITLYQNLQNNDSNQTIYDLTYSFCSSFERPANAGTECANRGTKAKDFTNYVQNGCR